VPGDRKLDEAKVKYLTGMGKLQGRPLFKNLFEFDPAFKLFVDSNRLPTVAGDENAVWNRIRVLPFNATIADDEKDKDLGEKLRAETPGILAWAVRGCMEWLEKGLGEPEAVKEATKVYRSETDTVSRFLAESCEFEASYSEKTGDLYTAYTTWCSDLGEEPESKKALTKYLGRNGTLLPTKVSGERGWKGIRLKGIRLNREHRKPHALKPAA
jgi:putative DNA primase/helicase